MIAKVLCIFIALTASLIVLTVDAMHALLLLALAYLLSAFLFVWVGADLLLLCYLLFMLGRWLFYLQLLYCLRFTKVTNY
jgi:NADH:ubiquinone oxidoreductase subunit 6 (subunit J)